MIANFSNKTTLQEIIDFLEYFDCEEITKIVLEDKRTSVHFKMKRTFTRKPRKI